MNYTSVINELLAGNYARFDASQTGQGLFWINHTYSRIWTAAPWPWRMSSNVSITATANTRATILWPTGAATTMTNLKLAYLLDDQTNPLEYVTPAQYFASYGATAGVSGPESTGHPQVWTWLDGSILWGPVPDATYTFTGVVEKNIFTRNSTGVYKAGVFDATGTDQPAWDEPFHYLLVLGATSVGLVMENDPSWAQAEGLFISGLEGMKAHFLPGASVDMQFPRDGL